MLIEQDRLDEAEDLLRQALRVWRGARYPVGVALATSNLGVVAARRGRTEESRALLEEALSSFHELGCSSLSEATMARFAELQEPAAEMAR